MHTEQAVAEGWWSGMPVRGRPRSPRTRLVLRIDLSPSLSTLFLVGDNRAERHGVLPNSALLPFETALPWGVRKAEISCTNTD